MFRDVSSKLSLPEVEERILAFWQDEQIFEKSMAIRAGKTPYVFYEGPPTANGKPGIHHVMARTVKDIICRYKAMKGYYVPRKAGWDTHGLPVEIAVEKKLGLTQKNQIDAFGVDRFNAACRDLVNEHIEMPEGWQTLTDRMGYWIDLDNAYITYKNEYIESVWWAIKTIFDKGLVYRGFKIVPQSPTIETPLSSHELSLGYKEVKDPNCYIRVKIIECTDKELIGRELLVWTTTPWTLISNVAMAVGEDIEYVLVRNRRVLKSAAGEETVTHELVLAGSRLPALDGEVEVLRRFKGRHLIGLRYEQIFEFLQVDTKAYPNAFTVLSADFVSTEDGSGIVHMAPAFGADDYEMSRKFNLPVLQPVTPGGRLTGDVGEFSGRTVKTFTYSDHTEEGVDKDVVIGLKKRDKLYRNSFDYVHSYPHCWRTDNPIIYYARESWFINSPAYKNQMVELNKTINWNPKEIGTGRFGNWLEDVKEWSLSRDRYWGSPLPIWVSEDNLDMICVGSMEELKTGLYENEDGSRLPLSGMSAAIDLHRPFVDRVVFEKDGKTYRRTPEIIDVWFDSGAMPFAQFHYPFENKDIFEQSFPADFIAEGIDQTRGWFYTLHNISTILFNKPAFKNIIVNELILDKNGQKMSKSKGNVVFPLEMMDRYGADALRWYFMAVSPPWLPKRFDEEGLKEIIRKFFTTLINTYSFFVMYANTDRFEADSPQVPFARRPEIDRWILSKLYSVTAEVNKQLDNYDITRMTRILSDYLIDDVSNWYVRRNRRRFWKAEAGPDKQAAYQTLHEILLTLSKLMAPVAPFMAEEIFTNLRRSSDPLSVHLCDFPELSREQQQWIDTGLEERMADAQEVVSSLRALRNDHQLKVRQPLSRVLVYTAPGSRRNSISTMAQIICEEVNVKNMEFVDSDEALVRKSAKPNFKVLGQKVGKLMGQLGEVIKSFGREQITELERDGKTNVFIDGHELKLTTEDVEILAESKADLAVHSQNGLTLALDLHLTDDLINEGLAREMVNRIQNLRKENGYEITDRIEIVLGQVPAALIAALENQKGYICNETLADALHFENREQQLQQTVNLGEFEFQLGLTRK